MNHMFNGTFSVEKKNIDWVPEGMCQVGLTPYALIQFEGQPETVYSPFTKTLPSNWSI